MDPKERARVIERLAAAEGFHRVAFTSADEVSGYARYRAWLDAGYAGDMHYLVEQAEPRQTPTSVLDGSRSVVVVALSYGGEGGGMSAMIPAERLTQPLGRVARYAQGGDYHVVMKNKLRALGATLPSALGEEVRWVACVDTAPLLERELAQRSGLGFLAKNTMLISPGLGSYFLLGALLVDVELEPGVPEPPRCGSCRACLDACPTGAFIDANTLDARRCISYLTIEYAGVIPRELRDKIGAHIFGCDICQDVCPFNQSRELAPPAPELAPRMANDARDLVRLVSIGSAQFRKWNRRSALRRIHRLQLRRNAAVALGNVGGPSEVFALAGALADPAPLLRRHAAWALGQIARRSADVAALRALRDAKTVEQDAEVTEEIDDALRIAASHE